MYKSFTGKAFGPKQNGRHPIVVRAVNTEGKHSPDPIKGTRALVEIVTAAVLLNCNVYSNIYSLQISGEQSFIQSIPSNMFLCHGPRHLKQISRIISLTTLLPYSRFQNRDPVRHLSVHFYIRLVRQLVTARCKRRSLVQAQLKFYTVICMVFPYRIIILIKN